MPQIQTVFISISCDGPGCLNSATFEPTPEAQAEAVQDYPWLVSHRTLLTADGRKFAYCSDTCEVNNTATGVHNKPERKRVSTDTNQAQIALAARAAAQARAATEALKTGSGVTLS
jgi:hypothetical protein